MARVLTDKTRRERQLDGMEFLPMMIRVVHCRPVPLKADCRKTFAFHRGEMKRLFAVIRSHGPAWDENRPIEEQAGWPAHVEFMNLLEREGFAVAGGLLEGSADALLVFRAEEESDVRARLMADPWSETMLKLTRIDPWQLRLGENRLAPVG
jgi:hypothetical protein